MGFGNRDLSVKLLGSLLPRDSCPVITYSFHLGRKTGTMPDTLVAVIIDITMLTDELLVWLHTA